MQERQLQYRDRGKVWSQAWPHFFYLWEDNGFMYWECEACKYVCMDPKDAPVRGPCVRDGREMSTLELNAWLTGAKKRWDQKQK